jgi:hypothetical protein
MASTGTVSVAAEDGLQGVVGVGEGDEAARVSMMPSGSGCGRSREVDQGEQYGGRVEQHVGRGGGEVGYKDPDAVRRHERRKQRHARGEDPGQGDRVQEKHDEERGQSCRKSSTALTARTSKTMR